MKWVWKYSKVFVCLIAGYLLFGVVSQLLPNKPIERHVQRTVDNDDLAADFGFAVVCRPELYMDNFTDALIVNQAVCGGSDNLWTNVMLVPRYTDWDSESESLRHVVARDTVLPEVHYARYWHGSTFVMRWLLQVEDYTLLRMLFYVLSSLLALWVCVALWQRLNPIVAGTYLLSLLLVNMFIMQLSIQFLPVLVIALLATLWVLYRVKSPSQICMTLFVVGSLTAYFDLLTCPALTWGMPLCVYLLKNERDILSRRLATAGGASVLWAVGYGVSWVTKWVLATLTTSENVLRDGFREFTVRSGATQDFTRWDAVMHNAGMVSWVWVCVILVALAVLAVLRFRREGWQTAVLCLLVALPPLLWYLAAAEHSYLHFWFTYRSMAVVLFALFSSVACLVKVNK